MRILITGSRDWVQANTIYNLLLGHFNADTTSVLVSGNCPSGADFLAENYWTMLGGTVELHPADWNTHGKKAGFVRNAEMVKLGADICLAFIKNHSKGATMTADLAEKAGIKTCRWEDNEN